MENVKKYFLLFSMSAVTLLAAATIFTTAYAFRAQEVAMDTMMRSYVLDLTDSVVDRLQDMGRMGRGRMMRFRMLSPALPNEDAGGVLVLTEEGRMLGASAGAEKLLPLWQSSVPIDEPRMVRDAEGNQFCVVAKKVENDLFVLTAVSRTHLLGPIIDVRRLWMSSAVLTSLAVFAGMLGLWIYLVAPLHWVVEGIRHMKWGRDRPLALKRPGFYQVEALSRAITELAGEAIAREELRVRYVSDIVRIEEDSRKRLARDLHDSPLQGVVAAIKRIQLARGLAIPSGNVFPGGNAFPEGNVFPEGNALAQNLEVAEEVAQNAAKEIRNFCDELSPSWVKLGLSAAMFENADRLSRAFGVAVEVHGAEETEEALEISEDYVLAFVRILQEAVSNSARHGEATHVVVSLQREESARRLLFRVQDDGTGFAAQTETDYERLRAAGHRGLAHINERVQLLKGKMRLESKPAGGCLIDIDVPL